MKITLALHPDAQSPPTRSQEYMDLISYADCTLFLWAALERLARLKPGETRQASISITVER